MSQTEGMPPQEQHQEPGREHEMTPRPDYTPRFPGSGRLSGKVAIITGGDSGIGRACAVLFAREGAKIAIVYLEEEEDAEETRRAVEAEGGALLKLRGDVRDRAFCAKAVEQTVEEYGRLDVLVNNAAEQHFVPHLEDLSQEQLRRTFETNVFGYFFMTQAALKHLGKGAAIVNTTSVTAYRGKEVLVDYSATRGAAAAFTRSMASQLAERGIRVNAVAPGPIWTPFIPSTFPAEGVAEFGMNTPLGRPGQPCEVASCHLFLACEDSSYMTGQTLHPNGGQPVAS